MGVKLIQRKTQFGRVVDNELHSNAFSEMEKVVCFTASISMQLMGLNSGLSLIVQTNPPYLNSCIAHINTSMSCIYKAAEDYYIIPDAVLFTNLPL